MKPTVLILFLLASIAVLGQDIKSQDLSWTISRIENVTNGTFDERGGTLRSYHTNRVEWLDASGALKQTFTIREINGNWTNIQNNGTILYEGDTEGKQATMTFLRDGSELRARMVILPPDSEPLIYEFAIQNYTTL